MDEYNRAMQGSQMGSQIFMILSNPPDSIDYSADGGIVLVKFDLNSRSNMLPCFTCASPALHLGFTWQLGVRLLWLPVTGPTFFPAAVTL
jgi:hypothetical protein